MSRALAHSVRSWLEWGIKSRWISTTAKCTSMTKEWKNTRVKTLNRAKELSPGLLAATATTGAGFWLAGESAALLEGLVGITGVSIGAIPCTILFGAAVGNAVSHWKPEIMQPLLPGIGYASKTDSRFEKQDYMNNKKNEEKRGCSVLRAGIVCIGAKLSAQSIFSMGVLGVPAVAASVGTGLVTSILLGKALNISPRLTALIAAGTSICGISAVSAVAPVVKASNDEIAIAVASVVVLGTTGILLWPYVTTLLFSSPSAAGMFCGLAVHDTAQVVACSLGASELWAEPTMVNIAAVTKLTRNVMMAGVIPFLGLIANPESSSTRQWSLWSRVKEYTPGFVLLFLGMSCVRSLGDVVVSMDVWSGLDPSVWNSMVKFVGSSTSTMLLGVGMGGIGLGVKSTAFRSVGAKPLIVAGSTWMALSTVAFLVSSYVGPSLIEVV